MQAWQATVQDDFGNAIPNPVVSVYQADGTTLATVYNEAGATLANPVAGNIDGFVQFYAPAGRYKIDSGSEVWEWSNLSSPPLVAEYDNLAEAVSENANGSVRINYDEQSIPSDFSGVLLEYTTRAQARSITQGGFTASYGMRTLRAQHEAGHPDVRVSTLNIESNVRGSGKNGPLSADYGQTINIAKRGFVSGSALAGEMDGLTITVRQDGVYGQPLGSSNSSDACGILINAVNVQDCGFVSAIEAVTENIQNVLPFAARYSIQTQIGTMTPNASGGPITYGYVTVANVGANTHAFYAGAGSSASWENVLFALGRMRITWAGGYDILTTQYSDGAFRIIRGRTDNGSSEIRHRGTGTFLINSQEAAPIYFATAGVPRVALSSTGSTFTPLTGITVNLGAPTNRWAVAYAQGLDIEGGGGVKFAGLPVHAGNDAAIAAGLSVNRIYRTATGALQVVF